MTVGGPLNSKVAGSLLLASGIIGILFNLIAEGTYPNYDVGTNAVSDLGAAGSPTAVLWNAKTFVSGILYLAGVLIAFKSGSLGIPKRNLVCMLYAIPGAALLLVAIFPENVNFGVHAVAALLAFFLGAISSIYTSKITEPPFSYFSIGLGIVSLIASILFVTMSSTLGGGLIERIAAYPFVIWIISFGGYLMALQKNQLN